MFITDQLLSPTVKAAASTGAVAAVARATDGTIQVDRPVYTLIAVAIGLAGVYLARLVTIDAENKSLGRRQTMRETGPLTWIGVLIICPLIWHFNIAVPWASMMGLGVGYSVRVLLRIFGDGTANAFRAFFRKIGDVPPPPPAPPTMPFDAPGAVAMSNLLPPADHLLGGDSLIEQLDRIPPVERNSQ